MFRIKCKSVLRTKHQCQNAIAENPITNNITLFPKPQPQAPKSVALQSLMFFRDIQTVDRGKWLQTARINRSIRNEQHTDFIKLKSESFIIQDAHILIWKTHSIILTIFRASIVTFDPFLAHCFANSKPIP